ncbi:hypothetical protein [Salibacterium lacus]|uniref:SLH domain-containing protein n=1 Tax=Salibacterium lacus TaxID=1898109 RepID=A0ABW5T646_9BACI
MKKKIIGSLALFLSITTWTAEASASDKNKEERPELVELAKEETSDYMKFLAIFLREDFYHNYTAGEYDDSALLHLYEYSEPANNTEPVDVIEGEKTLDDGRTATWGFDKRETEEVDAYIESILGIVPSKNKKDYDDNRYYEDGYYYLGGYPRGYRVISPQIDEVYQLNENYQYIEFTNYRAIDMAAGPDEPFTRRETWTDDDKDEMYQEKTGYVIVEQTEKEPGLNLLLYRTEENSLTSEGIAELTEETIPALEAEKYEDFRQEQYWSEDMMWAIQHDYLNGYREAGKQYLKPNDTLTEAQFLTVLFRYMGDLEESESKDGWWAKDVYQLAEQYNINTKGSLDNKSAAQDSISRGQVAVFLASIYEEQLLSEREAVQWMYDNGLSTGYENSDGTNPKTYKSYRAKDTLRRAHVVKFMKAFDELNNK